MTLNFETAHAEAALSKTTFDNVELAVEKPASLNNQKRIKKKRKWFQLFKKRRKIKQNQERYKDDLIFWSGLLSILFPVFALLAAPLFFLTFALFFAIVAYAFAVVQRKKGRRNFKINFGFAMSILVLSAAIVLAFLILILILSFNPD